jgi:hypothetical protein
MTYRLGTEKEFYDLLRKVREDTNLSVKYQYRYANDILENKLKKEVIGNNLMQYTDNTNSKRQNANDLWEELAEYGEVSIRKYIDFDDNMLIYNETYSVDPNGNINLETKNIEKVV